jgi:hypothetical protein
LYVVSEALDFHQLGLRRTGPEPLSDIPQTLLDEWAQRVFDEGATEGKHLVNTRGILQIDWPTLAHGGGSIPMDLLLATSNNPKPKRGPDPTVEAIAAAWALNGDTYFRRNRDNGIETLQDREIEALLP